MRERLGGGCQRQRGQCLGTLFMFLLEPFVNLGTEFGWVLLLADGTGMELLELVAALGEMVADDGCSLAVTFFVGAA